MPGCMSTPLHVHVTHTQHTHTRTHNTCSGHVYTSVCTYHAHTTHTYTHTQHRHLFESLFMHFLRLCQREPLVDSLKFIRLGLAQILNRAKRALEKDGNRHADNTEIMFGPSLMKEVKSSAAMFLPTPKFSRVGLAQILNRAKTALEKDGERHADNTGSMFGTSLMEEVRSSATMFLPTPVVRVCFVLFCVCAHVCIRM